MEHRQHPRFPVLFSSSFSSINLVKGEGNVVDLSIRGCRIVSPTEVQVGTTLQLAIHVSKQDPPMQVTQAVVRWCRAGSFGLEFASLPPEAWSRLQQLVKELDREPYQREAVSEGGGRP
ncbi:MAG TPA: PilZ domain-containing protein [Nitrospira sp.]|nr:PilZ domain-containing protein [Nitrospira sp.]